MTQKMNRDSSEGKTKYHLIIPKDHPGVPMVVRWAELLTRGAEHYSPRNWELASSEEEMDRFKESAVRHFFKWLLNWDDEDHAASVFFNIEGYEYTKARLDDRT